MTNLKTLHKLKRRLHAIAEPNIGRSRAGMDLLRFLGVMLILTLLVRGTAAATTPVVTVTEPYQGTVSQSFTLSGEFSPGDGTPLTLPEGLLVEQVFVQPGDAVTQGQTLAVLSADDVDAAIDRLQASLQQLEVQAGQLAKADVADPFAWQQAQQQLDRAYADCQQIAAENEQAIARAQEALDNARKTLSEVESRKPQRPFEGSYWEMATPEQAAAEQNYADWQTEWSEAQAAVQQAQSDLEIAQQTAESEQENALAAAQSAEDARNSAQHGYEKEAADLAESNRSDLASAGVLLAQLRQEKQELADLTALKEAAGCFSAPADGIVTEISLVPGESCSAVAGLLATGEQSYTLITSVTSAQSALLQAGCTISVKQGQTTGSAALESIESDRAQFTVSGAQWNVGTAALTVTATSGESGLCLPATAVNSDNTGDFIYLVETKNTVLGVQNVLVQLPVTVEERGDGVVRVSGALDGKEQVVSASNKPLSAGAQVRVDA